MTRIERATCLAAQLFKSRGADLLRYVRRRVANEADAREIAQETYLRFVRLAQPDRIDNAEAYLFRIASNLLWEHQLRAREPQPAAPAEEEQATELTPLDLAMTAQVSHHVRMVLEALPAVPRAVIVLHLRDGLTYEQIGAQIGVSVSMVKKHMQAALTHCRTYLRPGGE